MTRPIRQSAVPVAETFQRLARELEDVCAYLGEMHAPVGTDTWKLLVKDPAMVSAMQNIDRVEQTLQAMSKFIGGVSAECDPDWAVDISQFVKNITLTQLRDRLDPQDDGARAMAQSSGECEMF